MFLLIQSGSTEYLVVRPEVCGPVPPPAQPPRRVGDEPKVVVQPDYLGLCLYGASFNIHIVHHVIFI